MGSCRYCGEDMLAGDAGGAHEACEGERLRRAKCGMCTFCGERSGFEWGVVCRVCRDGGPPYAYKGYGEHA